MSAHGKGRRFLLAVATSSGLGTMLFFLWLGAYAFSPAVPGTAGERLVIVPPAATFPVIARALAEAGVVRPDRRFGLLARLMRVTTRLQAGEYLFTGSSHPYGILRDLHRGSRLQRPLTIPEGVNLKEIAAILAANNLAKEEDFLAAARDPELIRELGLGVASLEGYLFPETYFFERGGLPPRTIIRAMVAQTRRVLAETGALQGLPKYGLDVHQLLTLASIVEKETGLGLERPLIARVFLNRLRRGMRLQTDPTVIYGLPDFNGNLTRRDLQTMTPYNTYLIDGLPPGPIANPGRAAIEAVLAPATGDYYYFVSKNDGSHYFSKTLAEHNRAVSRFQKRNRSRNAGR